MNIDGVKHPERRFAVGDSTNLEIQTYGINNNYPQIASLVVSTSTNAINCMRRYAKFIRGNGFKDKVFYKSVVNFKGQTCDTLLRLCSNDLAEYGGYAIHINYNILGEKTSIEHIPFEDCRLGLEDDNGYVAKIAVNSDWTGIKGKKGNIKKNTDFIDVFNPSKEVVIAQIAKAGGINEYKGQILFVSTAGEMEYPKTMYDSAITDISTDEGLGNIRYRNARNNFFPAGMYVYYKGTRMLVPGKDGKMIEGGEYQNGFDIEEFKKFQNDQNACKIVGVGLDLGEEKPEFVEFPTRNFDKEFSVTRDAVSEEIYAAFGQEVFYRIRSGALGFSNDIINDAFNYYNAMTSDERILLEQGFKTVFSDFIMPINPSNDYSIIPLTYNVTSV